MKSTQYSEKVLDHFRNPRNVGTLEGEDVSVGRVGNPVCGDLMEIYIKVNDNKIEDIKLKTFGCGSAIATASMVTEMAKGKTLDEAEKITRQDVADELDGLPPVKMHCSNLAADALRDAIKKYRIERGEVPGESPGEEASAKKIRGVEEFTGKGVYFGADDLKIFKDRRVLLLDTVDQATGKALELTKLTPRVVLLSALKESNFDVESKNKLKEAGVRVLFESEILEIKGFEEVERVLVHDLDEDEKYELFVDVVILQKE